MASKPTDASMRFPNLGKEQTEAIVSMQKELLDAYDQSSRAWLARVKTEVDLWSDLAKKLSATQSVPDVVGAYQQCVAQRIRPEAAGESIAQRPDEQRTHSPTDRGGQHELQRADRAAHPRSHQ